MVDSPLILVVEDEFFLQADLELALAAAGFATDVAWSGEEALDLLMTKRHDAFGDGREAWRIVERLGGGEADKRERPFLPCCLRHGV